MAKLKMKITPRLIVKKMKRGYHISRERKERRVAAEQVKIFAKEGVQIPGMGYPPYGAPPYPVPPPEGKEAKTEKVKVEGEIEGVEITTKLKPTGKAVRLEEERATLKGMDSSYPLIPHSPKKGEHVFAYANIKWTGNDVEYIVMEPPINHEDSEIINSIKTDLEERLDIDFTKIGDIKAKQVLREEIQKSFLKHPQIDEARRRVLTYYIERDIIGMGKIETLMNDENIEDISCDGTNIPLYVYHRDPKFASLKTNIMFENADELNSFVVKLAQKTNKSISIAEPLLDGSLPDGSRIQATLGTDIARKGSNFTIRKFTEKPLTPTHMMKLGTLDSTQLAYLWIAVENGKSILVSGGTATGKTSLLNALSLFIRPSFKVVSIEDTAELRLPLPHWIPHVARTPLSIKGKVGEVTLFDLLKSSLRQRPDYIIVGEVRGREAFVLFQQMATGHSALATIHAASVPQLIDRLITPPISLPPSLLENIDIIVFLTLSRLKEIYVRRADNIMEVTGIEGNRPLSRNVFAWQPMTDEFKINEKSVALKTIARRQGVTEDTVKQELVRRKMILEWMFEKEVYDYKEVSRVINTYYMDPERLMTLVERE
jgi:flagellar protein FlaI